jgi:hypothetical protein
MWLTTRALGVPPLTVVRGLAGVVQATVPMAVAVLAARVALVQLDVAAAPRLALLVALGALLYVPLAAWRVPELFNELRRRRRADVALAPA